LLGEQDLGEQELEEQELEEQELEEQELQPTSTTLSLRQIAPKTISDLK
jgi:hypothetical protein